MGNTALVFGNILAADGRIENVTIQNGTLLAGKTNDVTNSYVLGIAGVDGATVKNVTTNGGINVYTESKDVVIDSCDVTGTKYYTVCAQCGSDVTIKGTTYTKNTDNTVANKSMFWIDKAGKDSDVATPANPTGVYAASSITIESGNFTVDFSNGGAFYLSSGLAPVVKGGTFNFDPTAYVADGYEAVDNGDGTWTVKSSNVAQIGETKYTSLEAAVEAAQDGDTIELLDNIALNATLEIEKSITINGNDKTITAVKGSGLYAISVADEGVAKKLTVNVNDLTLNTTGYQVAFMVNGDFKTGVTLDNVDINSDGAAVYSNGHMFTKVIDSDLTRSGKYAAGKDSVYYSVLNVGYSGSIEMTNGSITAIDGNGVGTFPSGGSVTLTGVDVNADNGYALWSRNEDYTNYPEYCMDSTIVVNSGNINGELKITDKYTSGNNNKYDAIICIYGGIFDNDPTAYVADGYEAVDNNDGTWTVGKVVANAIEKVENPTTGYDATYTATKQVVDNDDAVLSTGNSVTVDVKAVTENTVASDTSLDKIDVSAILDEIVAAAGDADNIKVDIKVVSDTVGVVENTITYEVHPEATVYVNDDPTGTTVAISNDDLEDNAEFTITLPVPNEIAALAESGMVKVTHRSEGYDDEVNFYTLKGVSGAYYVQFKVTHFSDFVIEADNNDGLFKGHSITLNGYINLNFFLHLAADQITDGSGTVVNFTWSRGDVAYQVKASDFDANTGYYKVPVRLPAAEMSYIIHATVTINGVVQAETNDYSVRDYCNEILDPTFKTNYENTYGSDKYDKLAYLVKTMLDYGAKAQVAFGRTDVSLAIAGVNYTMENVNIGMIEDAITAANGDQLADNLDDVATGLGVDYYASSLIYLSGNTIRHYFVGYYDADLANLFNGVKSGFYYYIDVNDVAAAELDTLQTFTIGTVTFKYSALDYVKSALSLFPQDSANYNLAVATYWYNQAANAYFAQ